MQSSVRPKYVYVACVACSTPGLFPYKLNFRCRYYEPIFTLTPEAAEHSLNDITKNQCRDLDHSLFDHSPIVVVYQYDTPESAYVPVSYGNVAKTKGHQTLLGGGSMLKRLRHSEQTGERISLGIEDLNFYGLEYIDEEDMIGSLSAIATTDHIMDDPKTTRYRTQFPIRFGPPVPHTCMPDCGQPCASN